MMCRKFAPIKTTAVILLTILISAPQVFSDAGFIGLWATGTYHIKPSGSNRLLVVIGHAESTEFNNPNLSAATYGGQTMTRIADHVTFGQQRGHHALHETARFTRHRRRKRQQHNPFLERWIFIFLNKRIS